MEGMLFINTSGFNELYLGGAFRRIFDISVSLAEEYGCSQRDFQHVLLRE